MRNHLRRFLFVNGEPCRVPAPAAPVGRNVRFVADVLELGKDEAAIFLFLLVLQNSDRLQEVARSFGDVSASQAFAAVAAATRLTPGRVAKCFAHASRLVRSGLVTVADDRVPLPQKLSTRQQLMDLVFLPKLDRETFVRGFLEPASPPTLGGDDFADRAAVELASTLLREGLRARARGVNLLLHGPTGVGKTELARLLGQEAGAQVLVVGRADCYGDSATASERLSSLRLALQLAPRGESVLLFDELEDLFRWELDLFSASRAAPQMSKQWFGSLLEENEVPIVWCTNRIGGIDPAFLRRFGYAVELKAPGVRQRAKVLAHHLGEGSALSPADVDAVAQRFEASPAQFATAVRGARLVAPGGVPDRATVERLLAPVHKAITGVDAALRPVFDPTSYRLDLLGCREDLAALADEISRFVPGPGPGVSLCLYGPPGTGKSELVKYLAWRCGRPLVYRRASDLVSPYVGVTEQNLAAAFDEARQDGSVLLFDEADSFLRDRRGAVRSWEVSQVNEFLQQLEAFQGIVACTTNLMADLDQAALRRFVFKLELRFLRPEQAEAMFAQAFPWAAAGLPASAHDLRRLARLAPGDFAAVSRRIRAVRAEPSAATLVRILRDEVALKDAGSRPIGF
jgi:SpoVK/Ycf46/Vps4 family AAA+-type ATPase